MQGGIVTDRVELRMAVGCRRRRLEARRALDAFRRAVSGGRARG